MTLHTDLDDEEATVTISARQQSPVDVTNLEQATAWDDASGDEWTVTPTATTPPVDTTTRI